jgi:hypothetical protein
MNLKRGFHRIFVVLAILWLMTVATFTVVLMPTKQNTPVIHERDGFEKWQQENISQGFAKEDLSLYSDEELNKYQAYLELEKSGNLPSDSERPFPSAEILRKRAAIRELQKRGLLPQDPNLIYKPPSFWQSEEGTKLLQQVNVESDRKLRSQQAKFIFIGFLVWTIPLALVYLMGVLIWWIIVGFRSNKV